jgi:hypothetical protein
MKSRFLIASVLILTFMQFAFAQRQAQSELSIGQRLDVMTSKLESMRRSLNSALSALPSNKDKKANADDPAVRLRGLEKEVSSVLSEVNDIRSKNDRAEKYDVTALDRLEGSVSELTTRVETALQQTASARNAVAGSSGSTKKKKKGRLFGLFGGGGDDKYEELTGAAVAGRDRVLFEEAAKEVR